MRVGITRTLSVPSPPTSFSWWSLVSLSTWPLPAISIGVLSASPIPPLEWLDKSHSMSHLISTSSGTDLSTANRSTDTGMVSLGGGGTLWKRVTCSAVICPMVIQSGRRVWLFASFYHPSILSQEYFTKGESEERRFLISAMSVSSCCRQSTWRIAWIWCPRRWRGHWSSAGSRRTEPIVLMSLHVAAKIQRISLASHTIALGIAL